MKAYNTAMSYILENLFKGESPYLTISSRKFGEKVIFQLLRSSKVLELWG